ncbi:hypothetical protein MMC18_006968 [Xylographa bjoerkii]|nr:hypothetical protein [Xylographa bjoerkii]
MKLLRLSQAYVTALDEAVRYTNEFLKQSIDPHAPDLLIWEEQVSGVYYPERVDKLKYLYRKYYVNMRGIIKSLLKTYGSVHESMDQIASQLLTIFDSADLNVGMSLYNSKRYRWQRSWRRLLPFTPYDDIAVIEEAQKAYRRINRICHKTLGLIERSEAELKCLLPQIAVSEAEINRTTNATMSVLEVQHMERNIRQMASKVKAALELRDRFQDAARGAELKFKRWERPTAYGEEAVW